MISESIVQQFLNDPNRFKYVCGISLILLLLLGLPAFDKYSAQAKRRQELRAEIEDLSRELENGEFVHQRLVEIRSQPAGEGASFDNELAMALREELVRLTRDTRCRLLNVQLGDPRKIPWSLEVNPLEESPLTDAETNFELHRTRLTLAAEGTLCRIDQLISRVTTLHAMAVPTQIVIRKANDNQTVKVDLTLSLIGLAAT